MIQQSTGFLTGSIYTEDQLKGRGFPGEGVMDSSVIVVKTHSLDRTAGPNSPHEKYLNAENGHSTRQFDKAILLIRDPHEAILSDFNRMKGGHTGHAELDDFKSEKWQKFFYTAVKEWKRFNSVWIKLFERYVFLIFIWSSCTKFLALSFVYHYLPNSEKSKSLEKKVY